jgi:hypothetical protein
VAGLGALVAAGVGAENGSCGEELDSALFASDRAEGGDGAAGAPAPTGEGCCDCPGGPLIAIRVLRRGIPVGFNPARLWNTRTASISSRSNLSPSTFDESRAPCLASRLRNALTSGPRCQSLNLSVIRSSGGAASAKAGNGRAARTSRKIAAAVRRPTRTNVPKFIWRPTHSLHRLYN